LTLQMFDQFPLGLGPFVERFGDKLEPDHVALFEAVLPRAGDWARSWRAPTVVQHGDFRTDNVMFGASPGAAPVTIIDFQTVRLGPPGVDLAYFIGASLSTEDRRAGDRELIAEYHGRLAAAGVEGFSFEDCWQSYREGALYGVFLFVGLASQVESTERGDQVIAEQIKRYARMAIDLDAAGAAGL
jgi:aminoglycoside phosphotransferase (APT) family kinase protein